MRGLPRIRVTGITVYQGAVQPILDCLRNDGRIDYACCIVVAEGAVGTVQRVNVGIACQGMALAARAVYQPVVMRRVRGMPCRAACMAGIAGLVADADSLYPRPDDLSASYVVLSRVMPVMT
jgi:hypothetical protein